MTLRPLSLCRGKLVVPLALVLLLSAAPVRLIAQASALPNANPDAQTNDPDRGRKLLDKMLAALGGDKWLALNTWVEFGQTAHFYKGTPDPYIVGLEEYHRAKPFGVRIVSVSHFSVIPGMPGSNYRDVATVWNDQTGYELTYKGKKELPKEDVAEFERQQRHTLDVVMRDWLKQPGTLITFEGTDQVQRRLAQKVSIINGDNDAVELELEESTHLPLSLSFRARNQTYKDWDSYTLEYSDYHPIEGIMTPLTLTRYKNGEMVSQRFLKNVDYSVRIPDDMFNPDRRLDIKVKK